MRDAKMQRERKRGEGRWRALVSCVARERNRKRTRERWNRDEDTPTLRVAISRIMMTASSLVVVERTRSPHVWVTTRSPTIHTRNTHGNDPTQRRHRRTSTRVPRSLSNDPLSPPPVSRACGPSIERASESASLEKGLLAELFMQKKKNEREKINNYRVYLKWFKAHMFRYI